MPTVSANGLDIAYQLVGRGDEAILLINGIADEKESWGLQAGAFIEAGYRVLSFDNRGIGGTTRPAGPYTTRQMADDAEWLTVPGGHAACWEFPERFNAAVLGFLGRHRTS
jgi:pimeloyl-ACP methyl ester carboxylesterase